MEQKWPLVYLKSLVFNPCTSKILWRGKMDSPSKCWQLHSAMLPLPALDMLPRSWCPLALVSPGPGVCPTMLFGPHIYLLGLAPSLCSVP